MLHKQQLHMQQILNYQDFYNLLTGRTPQAFSRVLGRNFKLASIGLTKEQWSILVLLWENDGVSQQLLAERSYRDRGSITRLIDNLEKEALVERKTDKNDRRLNLIFLTEKGKEIQQKVIAIADETVQKALEGVAIEEVVMVKKVLNKIYENLEKISYES